MGRRRTVPRGQDCPACGLVHSKCVGHRKRRNEAGELVPCGQSPTPGTEHCYLHGGKTLVQARAEGEVALATVAAHAMVEARLGRSVPIEATSVEMLALVAEAKSNVEALRMLVSALAPSVSPDGIAGNMGSKAKSAEAERHVFVSMYDAERDRLFGYLAQCRKLNIEEAKLEHEERVAREEGAVLAGVIRSITDGFRAALVAGGVKADMVDVVYRDQLPGLVRNAIEARSTVVPPAGEAA